MAQGEGQKAIEDFRKLLELAPEDVMGLQALSTVLSTQKQLDKALKQVNKAIELQPDSPLGYRLRAQIQADRGESQAALEDLNPRWTSSRATSVRCATEPACGSSRRSWTLPRPMCNAHWICGPKPTKRCCCAASLRPLKSGMPTPSST